MALVRNGRESGTVVGLVDADGVRPFAGAPSMLEALRHAPETAADTIDLHPVLPVDWTASLRDCVGFLDHVRNTRRARGVTAELPRPWFERPAFYFANPASLHPWDAPVAVPPGSEKFDFELEIAAVLVGGGENLTPAQAASCIGGYVLYCDWSARDIQAEEREMQIGQGKGKDAAISLGPWILTAAEADPLRLPDGFAFDVSVRVNGETVVSTPFRGMDWSFEELIAYASHGAGVQEGDLIASGTVPGGCLLEQSFADDFRGWLRSGDVVVLDAGPLGTIEAGIEQSAPEVSWRRDPATSSPTIH